MANVKITDLTAYTDPVNTDVLPIVDVTSDVTKKVSIANVMKNASFGSAAAPGISFDGDPNTGIYRPGADQVAISTNGTGQVFLNSGGELGVGTLNTTNIAGKLHVRADGDEPKALLVLQNRNTGGSAGGAINFVNGAVDLSDNRYSYIRSIITGAGQNGNHLVFGTNANGQGPSERLRLDSSGRLLVGTSSDSGGALLQVNGDRVRIATAKTPASASDTGTAGEVCWDASYIYVCTATNTWKRAALSTW